LLFRALAQLFDELRMQQDAEFSVRVSYLELYNEEIFDLLSATEDTTRLQLYEDSTKKGSVIIKVGSVFRIRGDILVRIRILGSVTLTIGSRSGSGSYSFRQWPSRCRPKMIFLQGRLRSRILIRID
jgi:hypothetical protein